MNFLAYNASLPALSTGLFIILDVFDTIWTQLGLQIGQQLFVFLHVDEFQLVDWWDEQTMNENLDNQT